MHHQRHYGCYYRVRALVPPPSSNVHEKNILKDNWNHLIEAAYCFTEAFVTHIAINHQGGKRKSLQTALLFFFYNLLLRQVHSSILNRHKNVSTKLKKIHIWVQICHP